MRESTIERHLHQRTHDADGEYRRVQWIGRKHATDDLILLPGEHFIVECKRPGEKPTPGQAREHERLRAAGFKVFVVSTIEEVDQIFDNLKAKS